MIDHPWTNPRSVVWTLSIILFATDGVLRSVDPVEILRIDEPRPVFDDLGP
jgi:hypothetical protein